MLMSHEHAQKPIHVQNLINVQVQACGSECVAVDTISRLNVRGSLLAVSGTRSSGEVITLRSDIKVQGVFLTGTPLKS